MWIFTKNGFVSAVRKKEYPDFITVRARDRESLTLSLIHISEPTRPY